MHIRVLGAGLAGCEAALYLAGRGYAVELWEQKPHKFSPAHKNADFAELVCSNSLKADRLDSASGLLKAEMKLLGSALLPVAEGCRVAAGGALAVDREAFAAGVTALVKGNPNITLRTGEAQAVGEAEPDTLVLTATGPLTEGALAQDIARLTGRGALSFYDAAAPIVTADSIDRDRVFAASRYGRGTADYLNCPFDKAGYEAFHAALAGAERAPLHDFDGEPSVYEGCMPIEVMAKRGADTMRYGPLRDGKIPLAFVTDARFRRGQKAHVRAHRLKILRGRCDITQQRAAHRVRRRRRERAAGQPRFHASGRKQAAGRAFHIALKARDLPGKKHVGARLQRKIGSQQRRAV